MTVFHVPDMTCGGCVSAITAAVKRADPKAEVIADLASHDVRVTASLPAEALRSAIEDAGFTPALKAA